MRLFAAQEMAKGQEGKKSRDADNPGLLTVLYQENGEIYSKTYIQDLEDEAKPSIRGTRTKNWMIFFNGNV
jgi:hypothetical protein